MPLHVTTEDDDDDDDAADHEAPSSVAACVTDELPAPYKKKKSTDETTTTTLQKALSSLQTCVSEVTKHQQQDACEMFGHYVASSLREMSPQSRMIAQAKIQNILAVTAFGFSLNFEEEWESWKTLIKVFKIEYTFRKKK